MCPRPGKTQQLLSVHRVTSAASRAAPAGGPTQDAGRWAKPAPLSPLQRMRADPRQTEAYLWQRTRWQEKPQPGGRHWGITSKTDKSRQCERWSAGRGNPSWDPQGPPEEGGRHLGRRRHLGKGPIPKGTHLRKGTPPEEGST